MIREKTPGHKLMKPEARLWKGSCPESKSIEEVKRLSIAAFLDNRTTPSLTYNSQGQSIVNLAYRGSFRYVPEFETLPINDWMGSEVEKYARVNFNLPTDVTVLKTEEQVLVYPVGAGIGLHCDDRSRADVANVENLFRVLTGLVYLNDDFEGGEMEFPDLGLKFKPSAGDAVIFPGNIEFKHRVHPITNGIRACIMWTYTFSNIAKETLGGNCC